MTATVVNLLRVVNDERTCLAAAVYTTPWEAPPDCLQLIWPVSLPLRDYSHAREQILVLIPLLSRNTHS